MSTVTAYPTGGQFLLEDTAPADIFTPEDFDETQRMIVDTVREFIGRSVTPHREEFEFGKKVELGKTMLQEAGRAGLLSVDIPEVYGGMGSDKATTMLVTEVIAWSGSFSCWHGAQTGIGTLPIVYFGTKEQKEKYLPKLATGELVSAYALSEPGAGTDALAARTTAVLNAGKTHYLLNGTKQYITNAGLADVFIVFAKVDGENFTAFIVDRDSPGLSIGPEEKKMGIKGSSTCAVILEDAQIPVANVLGEIGRGHVVAFNILNVGRFKLGAGTVGGCKVALEHAVPYVKQRQQFGRPLSDFGLIRAKIADIAARTFVSESMVYRTAGLMDQAIATLDRDAEDFDRQIIDKVEEFTIECSMIKVFATESLALAAEEGLQMLGGYGFCEDYPLEQIYRDERINRIFEGTNEINRMLVPGMILRKALKKELPFFAAAKRVADDLLGPPAFEEAGEPGFLEEEARLVAAMKRSCVAALGFAAQKHGENIKDQQEILSDAADMVMETYACESGLLRALKKASAGGEESARLMADMLTLYIHDAMDRVAIWGRNVLAQSAEGDELRTMMTGLRRLAKHVPVNRARLHDAIAGRVVEAGRYTV
ncbi:MAG: acyl-CoA dehydrogenase family protein [Gemmatimonadota bacterium]|nr:MAG: acyl-CoA dehydrogenase family protein [Gemmatimonadota bacterium]